MTALLAGFIIPTLQMTKLRLEEREEVCARPGAGNWIQTPVGCFQSWSLTRTVSGSTTPLGGISRNQWAGTRAGSAQNGSGLSPGLCQLPPQVSELLPGGFLLGPIHPSSLLGPRCTGLNLDPAWESCSDISAEDSAFSFTGWEKAEAAASRFVSKTSGGEGRLDASHPSPGRGFHSP